MADSNSGGGTQADDKKKVLIVNLDSKMIRRRSKLDVALKRLIVSGGG